MATTTTKVSFGTTLGRGIGKLGALAVEGAVRSGQNLGQFGEDVLAGTESGYVEQAALLKANRDAKLAARDLVLAQHKASVAVVAVAGKGRRATA